MFLKNVGDGKYAVLTALGSYLLLIPKGVKAKLFRVSGKRFQLKKRRCIIILKEEKTKNKIAVILFSGLSFLKKQCYAIKRYFHKTRILTMAIKIAVAFLS